MICKDCNEQMLPGVALINQSVVMGAPDFHGNTVESRGQTMSLDRSKADIIGVLKCPACGHSVAPVDMPERNE